jgi:torulene dioxygenase
MKVMYNSRRANEALIKRAKKSGKYGGITFGQRRDPCVGIFGKVCRDVHVDAVNIRGS